MSRRWCEGAKRVRVNRCKVLVSMKWALALVNKI